MKLLIIIPFFIAPHLLSMQEEQPLEERTEISAPLTCAQKTKKVFMQCCMPKITKIACAYCCCGTSCTQSIQSFSEYKMVQTVIPWMQNPYCLGATLTVGTCVSCAYGMYKTDSCCFKQKNINPMHQEETMVYKSTED